MSIEVKQVSKRFGHFTALDNVSVTAQTGDLVALLGPSGSGKTTLLRIIAGLEFPDSGSILFHGDDATARTARDRHVGFVFQHYALFKHMTVFENIAFGLKVRPRSIRPNKEEIADKVHSLLKLIQLDWIADYHPHQLSGGQRQRVALARALAVEPKILLLDEPFGALDLKVRLELRRWLRRLHDDFHITTVFVTHDQEEALEVADHVVLMNKGRIEQHGTPDEVYEQPNNPFVYHFLGSVNLFHGRVHNGRVRIGDIEFDAEEHADAENAPVVGYVRPHDIGLERTPTGPVVIEATIAYILTIGPVVRVELVCQHAGCRIEAELTRERHKELKLREGEQIYIKLKNLRIFRENGLS